MFYRNGATGDSGRPAPEGFFADVRLPAGLSQAAAPALPCCSCRGMSLADATRPIGRGTRPSPTRRGGHLALTRSRAISTSRRITLVLSALVAGAAPALTSSAAFLS